MQILRPWCTEQLRIFVSSKWEQTKIQEVWLCSFAYILFCLNINSLFWLLPPHANILNKGGDTPVMFISLHVLLNHIWHYWLLSCPGSPDRHPSANVRAILCSLAFRTQQGFVSASLLGAQKHADKCFKVSSSAPDSHDTQKYSKKSWRNLILSSTFPALSVHQFWFGSSALLQLLLSWKGCKAWLQFQTHCPQNPGKTTYEREQEWCCYIWNCTNSEQLDSIKGVPVKQNSSRAGGWPKSSLLSSEAAKREYQLGNKSNSPNQMGIMKETISSYFGMGRNMQ